MKLRFKKLHFYFLIAVSLGLNGCEARPDPIEFSEAALNDELISRDGKSLSFSEILEKHEGKTILIDVWASWCRDCLVGFPKLKELQATNDEVVFMYLSLDKTQERWIKGIEKYDLKGEHYFLASGWDGPFGEFVDLDWIPRYMLVDGKKGIKLFRAVKADDGLLIDGIND